MTHWNFCDDLDTPELGVCLNMGWWTKHKFEIIEWFENEGKSVGGAVSDGLVFVYPQQRVLFLLRFG